MNLSSDSVSFAEDKAKCDQKMGKEPSSPPEQKITVSESVIERIQTGTVDEQRIAGYDNYWMDKLACIDESHTQRNGLDTKTAESIIRDLSTYAESASEKSCSIEQEKLIECHKRNKDQALICNPEVENFVCCVDTLLAEGTRSETATVNAPSNNKKLTYAERFELES